MPSKKEFKDYVLEKLQSLNGISCKQMMGEYLIYYNGLLFGGIYDNRLLIKITKSNNHPSLKQVIPYNNAKPMHLIDDLEDTEFINSIIKQTCNDLKKTCQ